MTHGYHGRSTRVTKFVIFKSGPPRFTEGSFQPCHRESARRLPTRPPAFSAYCGRAGGGAVPRGRRAPPQCHQEELVRDSSVARNRWYGLCSHSERQELHGIALRPAREIEHDDAVNGKFRKFRQPESKLFLLSGKRRSRALPVTAKRLTLVMKGEISCLVRRAPKPARAAWNLVRVLYRVSVSLLLMCGRTRWQKRLSHSSPTTHCQPQSAPGTLLNVWIGRSDRRAICTECPINPEPSGRCATASEGRRCTLTMCLALSPVIISALTRLRPATHSKPPISTRQT